MADNRRKVLKNTNQNVRNCMSPQPGPSRKVPVSEMNTQVASGIASPVVRDTPESHGDDTFRKFSTKRMVRASVDVNDPFELVKLFLSEDLVRSIIDETNLYAGRQKGAWSHFSIREFWRFLSVELIKGLENKKYLEIALGTALSQKMDTAKIMHRDRCHKILSNMTFTNLIPRGGEDKFFKLGSAVDHLNETFANAIKPCEMVIAESHICRSSACDVSFVMVVDAETGFVVKLVPHDGLVVKYGDNAMKKLLRGVRGKHGRVIAGPKFASVTLAKKLKTNKIYYLGEVTDVIAYRIKQENEAFNACMKDGVVFERHETESGSRIIIATGSDSDLENTIQEKKNLTDFEELIKKNKIDHILKGNFCAKGSMKWQKKVFLSLVDFCVYNAYVLYNMDRESKIDMQQFLTELLIKIIRTYPKNAAEISEPELLRKHVNVVHFPQIHCVFAECDVCEGSTNIICISCKKRLCFKRRCFLTYHDLESVEPARPTKRKRT